MTKSLIFSSLILQIFHQCYCQGLYSILAPSTIRPNSEYHVAVNVYRNGEPATIKLGIISPNYSNFKTVEVRPFFSELVQFDLPDIKEDNYKLTAEGISGLTFTNETNLLYDSKQLSVLVQTDKAIYKPGDIIRFRILILDENLRPAKNYGEVTAEMRDSQGNLIRTWNDIRLTNSIYKDEIQLTGDFPALGEWTINVIVMKETHVKTFEVDEYIVPKYKISIETAKHTFYKDGKITAIIRAKEHFGKSIKGEVTVAIYPKFYQSLQPFILGLITRKVVPLDGKAYIEFDIKDELNFKEDYRRDILLEATVEEQYTGRKQNTSTVVSLYRDRYSIEAVRIPKYYVPNVPFDILIKVSQQDGTPIQDPANLVSAYYTDSPSSEELKNKTEVKLNNFGMATLQFVIPDTETADQQAIIVKYLDVTSEVGTIERKQSRSENFIQAEILNEKPTVNQEVNIVVRSNELMKYFMYQIVGRGDIITSRTINVDNSNYHSFKFLATFAMVPKANLIVSYVDSTGELIFDEQVIDFGDDLWNFVHIEAPEKSSPGQEVDITITTKPYSYIMLTAVDQSAVDIRCCENDITKDMINDELSKYDADTEMTNRGSPGHDSGLIILTNSDYFAIKSDSTKAPPTTLNVVESDEKLTKKTDIGPAHTFDVNTKPPLAGPYAFSRIPKPFWNRPRVHVMGDVMDTWLFMNISSGNDGRVTVQQKLPNSMNSWMVTAFSVDPITGLGIPKNTRSIEYFRSFYITTELPYSIKKGEIISIPFVVFNNQNKEIETEVTLYNVAREFDIVQISNELEPNTSTVELYSRQSLRIPANSAQSVSFMIQTKRIGPVMIKATANTPLSGDTIEKILMVEPEGTPIMVTRGILLDLRSGKPIKENITIGIPKNAIPDSSYIEVSVVGDLLASAIKSPEKLLDKPDGSGEQNMAKFMPNLMVLHYLQKANYGRPEIEMKAIKYLELGYQRQLFYRHSDGSFSEFGSATDKVGSTWLTAYVARAFKQAESYIEIDHTIVSRALQYLAKIQAPDGRFPELGDVTIRFEDDGISLTAFTLLAFLENSNNIPEHRNVISNAINYLVKSLSTTNDVYPLAISAYALSVANHNTKNLVVQRLDSLATYEGDKKWWSKPYPVSEKKSPWYNSTRSINNEITAYAALALLENNYISNAIPVLKWLVDQRTKMGSFVSSQDTVVGLQALIKFSERVPDIQPNVQVTFEPNDGSETRISVNNGNALVLQTTQLPNNIKNVTVKASGSGLALAQVSYKYNTNITGAWPRFSLDPQVNRISHANYLHLSICASFVSVPGENNRSNMAIMEVNLPSGFTVDLDTLPSLEANERIKKVETRMRNTVVVIYFDYLGRREICPTLDAYKTYKVTKHRPVPVIIYDVYDSARKARMFYRAPKSTLCDICEGSSCGKSCGPQEQRQSRVLVDFDEKLIKAKTGGGAQSIFSTTFSTTILIALFIARIIT
ncbi:thioester-containing protein 1 allele R1 [Condylostylus longicornis]|uniref:thioester-containing protein 1 allele R1 n=1 Tax=Condylostylus longicornis TaxID=2530218 RepID=UPI00244DEE94|nr:thioester-containing protein 1 allele R1 [Condylostylus longicornis]